MPSQSPFEKSILLDSPSGQYNLFYQRFRSLNRTITKMIERLDDDNFILTAHQDTFKALLRCLKAFGNKQFHFFYWGFGGGGHRPYLTPSRRFPPNFVLQATLDQITHDIEAIQKAIQQRIEFGNLDMALRTLELADKLAREAIQPAVDAKLLQHDVLTITFFEKGSRVRVIPYAPVALVGIPLDAIPEKLDADNYTEQQNLGRLLTIAHEVAHHVYRHGVAPLEHDAAPIPLADKLPHYLPSNRPWLHRWLEEIFSDIYGCLVAGPAIAITAQEMQKRYDLEHLLEEDDGEHPVGALRPYIYTQVLREVYDGKDAKVLNKLDEVWEKYLKSVSNPELEVQLLSGNGRRAQSLDGLRKDIAFVIEAFRKGLTRKNGNLWMRSQKRWTTGDDLERLLFAIEDPSDNQIETALLGSFIQNLITSPSRPRPTLAIEDDCWVLYPADSTLKPTTGTLGETDATLDAIIALELVENNESSVNTSIPARVWLEIFGMHGWTNGGAENPIASGAGLV